MLKKIALCTTLFTSPAWAVDSCLVGKWQADGADMAHVLGVQMGGSARHIGGRTVMEILPDGLLMIEAASMEYVVKVAGAPEMTVTVTGWSQGAMNADDGANYMSVASSYQLTGSAEFLGQRMEIPIGSGMADPWGTSEGTYGCTAGSVSFDSVKLGSIPRHWTRY